MPLARLGYNRYLMAGTAVHCFFSCSLFIGRFDRFGFRVQFYDAMHRQVTERQDAWVSCDEGGEFSPEELSRLIDLATDLNLPIP